MPPARPRPLVWKPGALSDYAGPLLLDTHIWVWYLEGAQQHLSDALLDLLDRSNASGQLLVSDISYWEVAVKSAKGKIQFSVDASIWLSRAERAPGIHMRPLERDILLLSTRLPGTIHNDPADRMLIATARLNSVPLVTADGLIVEYARHYPGTPVIDARHKASHK